MNIQSFITNCNIPNHYEYFFHVCERNEEDGFGYVSDMECIISFSNGFNPFDAEDGLLWTSPKWTKIGDIAFFFHSVSAKSNITSLIHQMKKDGITDQKKYDALQRQYKVYEKYGGKIFAIAKVSNGVEERTDEGDYFFKSKVYAEFKEIHLLDYPIPYNDFKPYILIASQSSITPLFGDAFNYIKSRICEYEDIKELVSCNSPMKIVANTKNWLQLASESNIQYLSESHFRSNYSNFLLKLLNDKKKYSYYECSCYRNKKLIGRVDNVIIINGVYIPVEIKINTDCERDLPGQIEKYRNCDCNIINDVYVSIENVPIIVIDVFKVMVYYNESNFDIVKYTSEINSRFDCLKLRSELENIYAMYKK